VGITAEITGEKRDNVAQSIHIEKKIVNLVKTITIAKQGPFTKGKTGADLSVYYHTNMGENWGSPAFLKG